MIFSSLFRTVRQSPPKETQGEIREVDHLRIISRVRELYISGLLQDGILVSECAQIFGPVLTAQNVLPVSAPSAGGQAPDPSSISALPLHVPQERMLPIQAEEPAPPERVRIMIKSAEAHIPARLSLPRAEERQVVVSDSSVSPASRAKRVLAIDKKTTVRPEPAPEEHSSLPRSVKIVSHLAVRMPTTTLSAAHLNVRPEETIMVRVKDLQTEEDLSEPQPEETAVIKRQIKPTLRFS
ncbi:hypothetical protein AUK40_03475 [Candidatus Wirthbacteria bacterium CG2_30_54_11]|uniref:Uncharacterized protein n=1 Tax=Candidatus Wirthbacteria bacterium CG2_30_54_11 TaxID=1817892 RepID=A0A1J5IJM5_9BACT|nr:MAG: hypothetical protein AUK40_03475 [Candidatus Wirthbacteria bacterium CG2_30_54_11]